jgi:hypothetical protein
MSKLIDRLDQISRGIPTPLGFTAHIKKESIPQMALLAKVNSTKASILTKLKHANLDAFVLVEMHQSDKEDERALKYLKESTWGATVANLDREASENHKPLGSDFLVFGIEGTRVDGIEEGDMGKVLRIPPDLDEAILRGLEDLPVDAILLERPETGTPLALTHMLAIGNVRAATSRYLLLEWDTDLTARELEHLRDLGVDGIVLDTEQSSIEMFTCIRQRINALPKRKPKGEQRTSATLPRIEGFFRSPVHHEEQDDDDDDDVNF